MRSRVSVRAIMGRVNRKLREDGEMIRRCRYRTRGWPDLGDFYIVDVRRNFLVSAHVGLEAYARELGCLAQWEQLDPDEAA